MTEEGEAPEPSIENTAKLIQSWITGVEAWSAGGTFSGPSRQQVLESFNGLTLTTEQEKVRTYIEAINFKAGGANMEEIKKLPTRLLPPEGESEETP